MQHQISNIEWSEDPERKGGVEERSATSDAAWLVEGQRLCTPALNCQQCFHSPHFEITPKTVVCIPIHIPRFLQTNLGAHLFFSWQT